MSMNIVVVDDEHGELMTFLLESAGYPTYHALDGEGAWQELLRHPVALVVTDYMMPGMDGCHLVSLMQATPRVEKTPILMLTALREDVVREKCEFDGYLHKPFTAAQLMSQVRLLLGPPPP